MMSNLIKVSAILLAAGLSCRMGEDKLLLNYHTISFLQQAVNLLSELPVYERFLVTTEARLEHMTLPPCISAYINANPENGQSGSIRIGIEAATGTHLLFLVADQPKLSLADVMPLITAAEEFPDKIIFPVIDSKPSSPTVFPAGFRQELLKLSGDEGGRIVRDAYPKKRYTIKPENPMNFIDIDTAEDFYYLNI